MIDLPPIDVQKEVLGVIDEQLAMAHKLRAVAATQHRAAQALSMSQLRVAFGSEAIRGWPSKQLGDVSEIVSGVTLGRRLEAERARKVPYLRVANVKDGFLDLSEVYETEATDQETQRLRLQFGDLLLTEGGDADKLGRGTCWRNEIAECIHQNHIFRVRLQEDALLPDFVSAQIGSEYGKAYFLAHAKQTTGIATINRKVLAKFPVLTPSLSVQQEVVSRVERCRTEGERLRLLLGELVADLDALPAALLRRAFAGHP
jgi:type I restriction enzyme S subunit